MTPEEQEAYLYALNQLKQKMAKMIDHAVLFGDSAAKAGWTMSKAFIAEPPGLFNCRCTLLWMEVPWQIDLEDTMDEAFGDTNPYLPEFRDL